MSYCRFSTDNFKCDVYAYESCMGGWQIHIATHRHAGNIPQIDESLLLKKEYKKYGRQYKRQMKYLETAKLEPIGLSMDGADFNCGGLPEFLATMQEIKKEGYHIPGWVFDHIKHEINESIK